MRQALRLALKAKGKTSPNPLVGAVVVKAGKVVGKGFHRGCGLPHAEREALIRAKEKAKGATLYVTLEPCFVQGKTPPCLDIILSSGINKVVIAAKDPNPAVCGRGIKRLKANKVKVVLGVCRREAERVNEIFFKNMKEKMPFVAAKAGQSLDGKIATASGESKWITAKAAREFSRRLRDSYDAVLVGGKTVRADNPSLDGAKKKTAKIIISSNLDFPKNCRLLTENPANLFIFTAKKNQEKKMPVKGKVFFLNQTKAGLPLKAILRKLYRQGIMSVFVEGGSDTLGRFFQQKLVDKVYFFIAPKIIGGKFSLPSVGGQGFRRLKDSIKLSDIKLTRVKEDILIQGYTCRQ